MTATRLAGDRLISRQRWPSRCGYIIGAFIALCLIYVVSAAPESSQQQVNSSSSSYSITSPASQQPQNLQSISKWLRLGSSQQRNGSAQAPNSATAPASGVAVEVSPPPSNMLFQYLPANRKPTQSQVLQPPRSQQQQQPQAAASTSHTLVATANRNTKLELTDQSSSPTNMLLDDDSDQFNLFVSNTCERDFMLVRVRTSRPFYGVIHTLNYRRKPRCSLEGDGALDYQLNISHALDSRDPAHCGVIKLRKQSEQGGEPGELLSVVLAIRVHRNVELSDDKFLVLNCTNRCRLFDCSSVGHPTNRQRQQLSQAQEESPIRQRNQQQLEKEFDVEVATSQDQTSWWARAAAKRAGGQQQRAPGENQAATNINQNNNTCSVWRFPWLLALVCCLAILLIGAAISNCIFCLTLSARSPPTTKTKPTSDDIQTDDDRGQHNQRRKQSTQQKYINYDNSEYYRPVDVTYLQAKDGTRRARLENNRRSNNSSSNGSHQRSHTHSKSNLGAKTSPKR